MSFNEQLEKSRRQSYANCLSFYDEKIGFPNQVFKGCWYKFLFFQSDFLLASDFVDVAHELLCKEGAHVVCMLNLDRSKVDQSKGAATIYLDENMNSHSFREKLVTGGPANGWLFAMDRYVCTSDTGNWCIYCEKDSDIAVVALRDVAGSDKLEACFRYVYADSLANLLEDGASPRFPFNQLIPEWREGFLNNYTRGIAS